MEDQSMENFKITTHSLIIRNLRPKDLSDFHLYRSKPEIARYQGFNVMDREQTKKFIEKNLSKNFGKPGEWVQYGIEKKATGQLIGDCAIKLQQSEPRIAEIGITISHLEQKKGYAKEAMLGILGFLFDEKGIHRIVETVATENLASINLMKSIGFRQEGHFVENIFFKGKWGSEFQYAMLKKEWNSQRT